MLTRCSPSWQLLMLISGDALHPMRCNDAMQAAAGPLTCFQTRTSLSSLILTNLSRAAVHARRCLSTVFFDPLRSAALILVAHSIRGSVTAACAGSAYLFFCNIRSTDFEPPAAWVEVAVLTIVRRSSRVSSFTPFTLAEYVTEATTCACIMLSALQPPLVSATILAAFLRAACSRSFILL